MICKVKQVKNRFLFEFEPQSDDYDSSLLTTTGTSFSMSRKTCFFDLPSKVKLSDIHPDMLAMAAILMAKPFVNKDLVLPKAVSSEIAELCQKHIGINLSPVDSKVKPRDPLQGAPKAGLCFSGGVDSTAAAIVLPKNTALVFVNRVVPEGEKAGLYKNQAAIEACRGFKDAGREAYMVDTDFEFLRKPTGFATHYSSSVPVFLMADAYGLSSVNFGMILESAYATGDAEFRQTMSGISRLIDGSGLRLSLPVSGMSEICTSKIVLEDSQFGSFAQSCVRGGGIEDPCNSCMKCYRKSLVRASLSGGDFSAVNIRRQLNIDEVFRTITKTRLHHESVYAYIYRDYKKGSLGHWLFRRKVLYNTGDVSYLDKWYEPSVDRISPDIAEAVKTNILSRLKSMDVEDVRELKSYDPNRSKKLRSKIRASFWHKSFVVYAWVARGLPL